MIDAIEPTLYIDPQREPQGPPCPWCGGTRFLPGLFCLRCRRWEDDTV